MLYRLNWLLIGVLFFWISMVQAMNNNVPADQSFGDQLRSALSNPGKTLSDNVQIVHLIRALSHIPYIMTVDSSNPTEIKTTAMLAASSTSFKLLYERFRKMENYRLMYNLYHEPKLLCYLLAAAYDVMRFLGAPEIALKNEEEKSSMRGFKINQAIQLVIEICLRSFAFVSNNHAAHNVDNSDTIALCASEIADWVEIWRLLSRYSTYMNLSKVEANFNISVKKEEDKYSDRTIHVGGSIDPQTGIDFELDHEIAVQQENVRLA